MSPFCKIGGDQSALSSYSQGVVTPIDCTNTRDRGQELGQAVKAENLEGQAVKGTSQIRKSQGSSTVKVNRI